MINTAIDWRHPTTLVTPWQGAPASFMHSEYYGATAYQNSHWRTSSELP